MKNCIIGVLLVCILVILSFMYKSSKTPILGKFPIENKKLHHNAGGPPLYIYIFFRKHNCPTCLEAIQVLNELPSQFIVTGIVKSKELKNEVELREVTGATFDLIAYKDSYKRFVPNYYPTIFGVGGNGKIFFVLPAIPGEKEYLEEFLIVFYNQNLSLLMPEKKKE